MIAQYNVGVFYGDGLGTDRDYEQALIWLNRSADAGYARAHFRLGEIYAQGRGVQQDYALAYEHMWLGAELGDKKAKKLLKATGSALDPQAREAALKKAQTRFAEISKKR